LEIERSSPETERSSLQIEKSSLQIEISSLEKERSTLQIESAAQGIDIFAVEPEQSKDVGPGAARSFEPEKDCEGGLLGGVREFEAEAGGGGSKFDAATVGDANLPEQIATAALSSGLGLVLECESGLGFVTSAPKLSEFVTLRFIDADERMRNMQALPDEALVALGERVLAGIEAYAKANEREAAGELICKAFRDAGKDPQKLRKAAIEAFSNEFLAKALDERLRPVKRLGSLDEAGVREVLAAAGELAPYAELLVDAMKKLEPGSTGEIFRSETLDPAAVDFLKAQEGGVLAFTSFTAFSDKKEGGGNVLWALEARERKGTLLPPGSAVQIVSVVKVEGEPTVVRLRDLPLVKQRLRRGEAKHPLKSGKGFGFVTSKGSLDPLTMSQFIDADERARAVRTQSVDAVLGKVKSVIAAIRDHAKAKGVEEAGSVPSGMIEAAGAKLCKKFEDAMKNIDDRREPAVIEARVAAIVTYTMSTEDTGYFYRDLNRQMRDNLTHLNSLDDVAVRGGVREALSPKGGSDDKTAVLLPYAEMLTDAIRMLDPNGDKAETLYRGQGLAPGRLSDC
jgi:hypothetical protein